ncbi:MAG: PTS sugar transporter subunit IIC, partial [Clostridia bacterium]|nr:PTS sugar transporter subunit IIC [Clostridia bacterium]
METNETRDQEQTVSEQPQEEESKEDVLDASTEQASDSQNTAEETAQDEKPETKGEKAKRIAKKYAKRYFIDAFTGMAQGLFCTLIAGTILGQIASWCGDNTFAYLLSTIANLAKMMMGVGIGVGIAHKLGAKPLVIFTAAVTGLIGAWAMNITSGTMTADYFSVIYAKGLPGNPIGAYIVALLTVEVAGLYAGKTKLDIVLVPLGMMVLCLAGVYIAWPFIKLIDLIAQALVLAIEAGEAVKIIVGIFVAVVMGVLLTMPTSSAAIWVSIATSAVALEHPDVFAIAGGAAVAGCSSH